MPAVTLRALRDRMRNTLSAYTDQVESEIRLIFDALGVDRIRLITEPDQRMPSDVISRVEEILLRRERREPLQYILGRASFRGLDLHVGKGVLIPRPETERMVDWLIEQVQRMYALYRRPIRCFEIGVGSGAISISLAQEVREEIALEIAAIDSSAEALSYARTNVEAGSEIVRSRVRLMHGDLFGSAADDRYDLIYSNPPYVAESEREQIAPEVADYEPASALFAGDGYALYRRIFPELTHRLAAGGGWIFEIGAAQGDELLRLAAACGYPDAAIWKDYTGKGRFITYV